MIQKLLLPAGIEQTSRFVLEKDDGLDQRVGFEDSHGLAAEIDNDFDFAFQAKSSIPKGDRHRVRVHRLEMSASKLRMDLVENTNDLICYGAMK